MKQFNKNNSARNAICLIVFICPIFIYLMGHLLPTLPSSNMLSDSFWSNKIANEGLYDILVVGDSRIYRGINPEKLSEKLGEAVFNYGFSAAGMDSALISGALHLLKPNGEKILILGISPSSFTNESFQNNHLKTLKKLSSKDLFIRKNIYPKLSFFNSYSLSDLKKIMHHENYFQIPYNNGFIYSNKVPNDSFSAIKSYKLYFAKNQASLKNQLLLINLVKLLKEKGVTCFAFRVPVAAPMAKIENDIFDFKTFENTFNAAGGQWISIPNWGFNSYDGSHLDGPSANKLSLLLADSIAKYHYFRKR